MRYPRFAAFCLLAWLTQAGFSWAQSASPQFNRLDRNQDGQLTKDEFSGPLFQRIDANNDGVITAEEDRAFVRRRAAAGQAAGASVPDTVRAELDVPYAGTDNPRQRLDMYLSKTAEVGKPMPVVVFI